MNDRVREITAALVKQMKKPSATDDSAAAPVGSVPQNIGGVQGSSPNPDYLENMLAQEMRLLARQGLFDDEGVLTERRPTAYHREVTICG
ncbi:hypothetical protein WJ0W_004952 [Paenibacillus melissococcoides]|uniref:Uncharacterized protein n=2 Tax=Paenibacillus melissococcoides TaxID=2912268 RepID=A0ABM9G7U3_9BACL|nr:hypothetical protein WJ0W_004952 [Paenibacillus melissococcoides]